MWRAALPCSQHRLALLGLVVAAATATTALPSSEPTGAGAAPAAPVWGIAFSAKTKTARPDQLRWLSARGVTAVVALDTPRASLRKLSAAAASAKLNVIAPMPRAPKAACKSSRAALRTCAAVAPTAVAAVKLARRSLVDYVVVRVTTPRQLRMLSGSRAKRSRLIAVLPLSSKATARTAWKSGVAYATSDPMLELAVASAPSASPLLGGYLSAVPRSRTAAAVGPATPTSLVVVGRTASTVSLRWAASAGAVSGYGVYMDGAFALDVAADTITLTGLQCGRTYTFEVDAHDADGARSSRVAVSSATDVCPGGGGGGGGGGTDGVAPTTPTGLVRTSGTQTSITVSWGASTDNVGVAGYGLYRGGSLIGSSLVRSYSFSGLTCATSYSLAVDAYDAAGNRSGRTTISAATSACSGGADTSPPSQPGSLTRTGSTATSISVSWTASTDNVGVSGYGLYRNGTSTGSTGSTSTTFSGLACGTSYTLGVDAYDAAGNRSTRASLTTATSACAPPTDTQAPSVPQGMAFGTITETTVALVWNASSDNVAVAGYRLSRNGVVVASVLTPGYTYTGLTCGISYTFTLEAYDAAGNFSNGAEATGTTSTAACSGGGGTPPPPPPPPSSGGSVAAGQSWQAAYDAAAAGSVINVLAGNHGTQRVNGSKQVTFLGQSGAVMRQFWNYANGLTLDNVDIDGNAQKLTILESHGDNAIYRNLEIRNNTDVQMVGNYGANASYDNVFFHDAVETTAGENAGIHMECVWSNGPSIKVRNSVFKDCAIMDLYLTLGTWWTPPQQPYTNVVVEDNIFWPSERTNNQGTHFYGFTIIGQLPINGWTIRRNRFDNSVGNESAETNSTICGNTGAADTSWKVPC